MADDNDKSDKYDSDSSKPDKMFTLKKWNSVAMWSWDVECEICAICRVQVMDACLRYLLIVLAYIFANPANANNFNQTKNFLSLKQMPSRIEERHSEQGRRLCRW